MIDIIIPAYNASKTLDRTLSSILNQIKIPQINVYIIDDASDDNYDSIIEHYKKFFNIEFVRLEKNSGPGYAREYGLNISNGNYIIFLDSDDIFASPLSVNQLYSSIIDGNYDVVRSVIYEELDDGYTIYKNENIGLHGKIYKRLFIQNNNIHFNDSRSNEDVGFNALIKLCGARYKDINDLTYFWCNNQESITRKNKEIYKNEDLKNFAYNMNWALEQSMERNYDKKIVEVYSIEVLLALYDRLYSVSDESVREFILNYSKKIFEFYNNHRSDSSIEKLILEYKLIDCFDNVKEYFREFLLSLGEIEKYEEPKMFVSQKERMEHNLIYAPLDLECGEEKSEKLELMYKYNKLTTKDIDLKQELLQKMFGSIGYYSTIEPPFFANWGGKNVYIGNNVYINFNVSMVDDGNIYIGDNVLIGPNVNILTTNHPINPYLRSQKYLYVRDVNIKNNVWIGSGTIILPGVTIGENSVIGAGSVVTKDIPANVVAVGNPCKVVREINDRDNEFFYKNERIDWENIV